MTIDGLLTFVGLIVALLALASDARRSALMLRPVATVILTTVFGLAVLYLELFDLLAPPCPWGSAACAGLELGDRRWITPQQAAFLLVLIWIGLIMANLNRSKLKPRHLPRLLTLANALAEENRYSELCRVCAPHLDLIASTAAGKGGSEAQQQAASALQRLLYRRNALIRFIAMERPAMAVKMMAVESYVVFDFADQVLTLLATHSDSPLFSEISDNQNITLNGYAFPSHNTYLHFLMGNAKQAERLAAWRPVMEAALTLLGEAMDGPYQSFLNGSAERFDEGKWRDRTYVAIRYLDLMVDASLRQGVEWHMWLFYTPHLTARLLELYDDPRRDHDVIDEWPTRGSFLLYALFAAQRDWIKAVADLPDGSPHRTLGSTAATHENGNIPKSAILALGDCLHQVLRSDALSDRFKFYLADIVFRCIADLPADGPLAGFRQSLVTSVLAGGALMKVDHHARLLEALGHSDHLIRGRVKDLEDALERSLGVWPRP